ncbi:hypothetical protein [Pseudodesulfovibrio portus]|uniref:DUF1080 domain-containing protein n=1 Tax=Pseudodesulfovibrio portus TaxID=231439 RepID=A0ABN6S069_9BACT|nr:hypothetical protein [Pseudodesulfovibrio portus]BDQ35443.1 hypothetical protein JCM14722_29850 [Pseudodesulfovibrio portus]
MKFRLFLCLLIGAFGVFGSAMAGNLETWEGTSRGEGYTGNIVWEMTPIDIDAERYELSGTLKAKFNHRDHGKGQVNIRLKGEVRDGMLQASGNGRGRIMARSFKLRVSLQGTMDGETGNGTLVSNDDFKLIHGTWEVSKTQ